jgi:hypothetical protein
MSDPAPAADLETAPAVAASPVGRRYDRSIVEGPLTPAVWMIAWPTMVQNIIGGLQGIIDHIMVGHYVGYTGNAGIGVSWQLFLVVIVFISSLFTGMSVLVARFAGAGDSDKVDRTVYQAFLTAVMISLFIMAPVGYFASPMLLDLVNAAPAVKAQALPFLRIMFSFSTGMLIFYMLGAALRSAGDARTPMVLGAVMVALNIGSVPSPPSARPVRRWAPASRRGSSRSIRSTSSGAADGWSPSRGTAASRPTGRSSGRSSSSACRQVSRGSR